MSSYEKCISEADKNTKLSLCSRGYCSAKEKFKVYPSAYANGYASQVCQGKKPDALGRVKADIQNKKDDKDLKRWFDEKWVNVCEKDENGKYIPCGKKDATLNANTYPYCRPLHKLKGTSVVTAKELSNQKIADMCRKKRSIQPGVDGKPTRVYLRS
jgi:hypothetical protein